MKRRCSWSLAAAVVAACSLLAAPSGPAALTPAADDQAVRAVVEEIIAADNRGDLATVVALYSDDAVLLPPGEPLIEGRAAIEERYRGIFANAELALESKVESVRLADGWAVARGTISGRVTSRVDAATREVDDKFVMVLEKVPSGAWTIAELMWSANSRPDAR